MNTSPRLLLTLVQPKPDDWGCLKSVLIVTGCVALFGLLTALFILLGFGVNTAVYGGVALLCAAGYLVRKRWPDAPVPEIGKLLKTDNLLILMVGQQQVTFPLNASTRVKITYQGFKDERLGGRLSASGVANFIQFNDGREYQFAVLNEWEQQKLRNELRRWYQQKVQLREYRRKNRTFLLHKELSDAQSKAFQQEFGVKLYL